VTWIDIMNFHLTTAALTKVSVVTTAIAPAAQAAAPTDGTMSSNTVLNGVLGSQVRVKLITASTVYSGLTSIQIDALAKG
jgi:hypothetical protein